MELKLYSMKILLLLVTVAMVSSQSAGKPGDCPPATAVDICEFICWGDSECPGEAKCCPTACGGAICTRPVTSRRLQAIREKPGSCPRASGPWVCSSRCSYDGDCRGSKKCCRNRCGAMACVKPEL